MNKLLILICFLIASISVHAQQPAESLQGNWFKTDGSNTWGIGLHPNYAVYNSQFWEYSSITQQDDLHTIELSQPDAKMTIKVYEINGGLFIKDGKNAMRVEAKRQNSDRLRLPNRTNFPNDFISRGQVELMGVIEARDTMPITASVIFNQTFSSDQSKYTVNVDSLGRFKFTFPLESPQSVMISVGDAFTSFLAEPDTKMSIWIDESTFLDGFESWYVAEELLFMGDMAQENEEYRLYNPEYMKVRDYFVADSMQRTLGVMEYMAYRQDLLETHDTFNEVYFDSLEISTKVREFARRDVRLYAANDLMRYSWLHNMRTTRQRVALPEAYVAEVRSMVEDDPREMLSGDYGYLMSEMSRVFSDEENKANHKSRVDKIYALISAKDISTSDNEVLENWKNGELEREGHNGYTKLTKAFKDAFEAYIPEVAIINRRVSWESLKERATEYSTISKSSMVSQYLDSYYFKQGNNIPDDIWKEALTLGLKPEVVGILERKRVNLDILKNQRFVEGVSIATTEDDILGQLKKKYAGKVVYIDVWAVWCGPCISEFSYLPEIKANLKDQEDVVFVYLCAQSGKKGWETMVKKHKLKGDNYFLDDEQYGRFDRITNVTGFPTYMVITKEGKLVREGIKRPSAGDKLIDQLKEFAERK